jgi:uncharacterized protein (TIGR01777 family)
VETAYFEKSVPVPVSAKELHDWHMRPAAFERLTPPWEKVRTVDAASAIANGNRHVFRVKIGPFWKRWIAEFRFCKVPEEFTDAQIEGPFSSYAHRHRFVDKTKNSSLLVDAIDFNLPFGFIGKVFGERLVRRKLEATFRYRHRITIQDLARESLAPKVKPKTILITGASGLVGQALIPLLKNSGHRILTLSRNSEAGQEDSLSWNPDAGELHLASVGQIDAVVHLAGENLAAKRWNKKVKDRIFYSRKKGTRLIADTIAKLSKPPEVIVSASGINYYESSPLITHTEDSPPGTSFLAEVCRTWEDETWPAKDAGIRTVQLRIGVVLSPAGGALDKLLLPFLLGGGGRLGNGRQRMSWIAIDDLVDIIHRAIEDKKIEGPVNAVAPQVVSNAQFSKTLAKVLSRPAILPMPAFALRKIVGGLADEALLVDLAVAPQRLQNADYTFRFPDLEDALRHLLGKE